MIQIVDKSLCCGCWACENACPKHCIDMKMDSEGFHYPEVDVDVCINCGLCDRVCPIKQPVQDDTQPQSFVVQHKDTTIRRHSTSGGFYSALSHWVIGQGGVVFGAAFDENMVLRHSYSETWEGCAKFRGSKYVQSLIGDTYREAKRFLEQGRMVAFSGTPCQIAGLYGYLRNKKYKNLITVDLVCRGTPSPRLLVKYLAMHAAAFQSRPIDYKSRNKYYGYDYSTASITFEDKDKHYHKGMESDLMLKLYFSNICSRPSCYACHFKTLHRISDITIFDCWEAPSVSSKFDRTGATNVFIHTEHGKQVFDRIRENLIWNESDIISVIARDGLMIKNRVPINPRRKEFFEDLNAGLAMDKIADKYIHQSMLRRMLSNMKPLLYKFGVFSLYMKLKKF